MLVLLFAGTYANGYMESKHFDLFTEAKESKQIKEDENKLVKFIKGNNLELDNKEQIDYKNAIKIYTDINIDKDYNLKNGCIIFSVGERKNSLPTLNFCKKIGTHIKSHV